MPVEPVFLILLTNCFCTVGDLPPVYNVASVKEVAAHIDHNCVILF